MRAQQPVARVGGGGADAPPGAAFVSFGGALAPAASLTIRTNLPLAAGATLFLVARAARGAGGVALTDRASSTSLPWFFGHFAGAAGVAHPGGGFIVGQSMDNTLVTYAVGDRVGRALKKTFKGHVGAGYACMPAFSPDGSLLATGDGDGSLFVYEWRSTRVVKSFPRAHTGAAVGLAWHPLAPSTLATSGLDGKIHIFE
jgi:hypothetical protein